MADEQGPVVPVFSTRVMLDGVADGRVQSPRAHRGKRRRHPVPSQMGLIKPRGLPGPHAGAGGNPPLLLRRVPIPPLPPVPARRPGSTKTPKEVDDLPAEAVSCSFTRAAPPLWAGPVYGSGPERRYSGGRRYGAALAMVASQCRARQAVPPSSTTTPFRGS